MKSARVVTLNLWGEQPPLDARLKQTIKQLDQLAADVVLLQEVRQIPNVVPNTAETIGRELGYRVLFAPATPWGGGDEGLAILTRLPVLGEPLVVELPHATPEERRILLGAQLSTDAGRWAVYTTHLTYRLADGQKRDDQVQAALKAIPRIDSDLPRVFGGDFNAVPDSDEIRALRGLRSVEVDGAAKRVFWQDAWERAHGGTGAPGFTWSRTNPHTERLRWLERDRRIDYLFVEPMRRAGAGEVLACEICCATPDTDGVFASDHFGLCADVVLSA